MEGEHSPRFVYDAPGGKLRPNDRLLRGEINDFLSGYDANVRIVLPTSRIFNVEDLGTPTDDDSYELPDGEIVGIGNERYRAADVFWHSSRMEEEDGLREATMDSIMRADLEIRLDLYWR